MEKDDNGLATHTETLLEFDLRESANKEQKQRLFMALAISWALIIALIVARR